MPELPLGWREEPLAEVAEVRVSNVDKKSRPFEIPVKLCNYLDAYREDYLDESHPYMVATATPAEVTKFGLRAGDVLVTKDSETPDDIGVAAVIESAPDNLVCGYHLAIVRPTAQLNPVWLAKQFGTTRVQRYLASRATGSTRYGLSNATLGDLPIVLPLREEQDSIIEVLRTLDEAISHTEQLIVKLDRMKQGLLHDLLTCGIDESGSLRNPHRHPAQFYDSALGRIPTAWQTRPLVELLACVMDFRGKTPLKIGMAWGGGDILALSANNVAMGRIDPTKESYRGSLSLYHRWMTRGDCEEGDIVLTMEAPLGNVATIPDRSKYILSQRVVLLRPLVTVLNKSFAKYQMSERGFQDRIRRESTGTTAVGIRRRKLEKILVILPPLAEQEAIAQRLDAMDDRLRVEETVHRKLKALRLALARDLLTGRVRAAVVHTSVA